MKIPHTPGPWHTDAGRQTDSAGLHLAYIEDAPGLGHAAEANALLRDAAPCWTVRSAPTPKAPKPAPAL